MHHIHYNTNEMVSDARVKHVNEVQTIERKKKYGMC